MFQKPGEGARYKGFDEQERPKEQRLSNKSALEWEEDDLDRLI